MQTSRESTSGPVRQGSSQGTVRSPTYGYVGSGTPFAVMRRMMEDMDRLLSDFAFTQPGALGSGLFTPDLLSDLGTWQRALPSRQTGQQRTQRGLQRLGTGTSGALWAPQVEIFERGNNLVVRADLPGLSKDDVDVEVENDALIIRGERRNEFEDEQEGMYRSERSYGSFYRAIPLPENMSAEGCKATFKDGVLEVTIPKPEQPKAKSRKIDIK